MKTVYVLITLCKFGNLVNQGEFTSNPFAFDTMCTSNIKQSVD